MSQRSAPRVPVDAELELTFDSFTGFLGHYATNISSDGMFVRDEQPRPVGTELRFALRLEDGFPLVHGRGEVAWARLADEGPERPPGMGVRFLEIDPTGRELIAKIEAEQAEAGRRPFDLERERPREPEPEVEPPVEPRSPEIPAEPVAERPVEPPRAVEGEEPPRAVEGEEPPTLLDLLAEFQTEPERPSPRPAAIPELSDEPPAPAPAEAPPPGALFLADGDVISEEEPEPQAPPAPPAAESSPPARAPAPSAAPSPEGLAAAARGQAVPVVPGRPAVAFAAQPEERSWRPGPGLLAALVVLLLAGGAVYGFSHQILHWLGMGDAEAQERVVYDIPPVEAAPPSAPVAAAAAEPATTSPTPPRTTPPLTQVRLITWKEAGDGTVVTLWGNGSVPEEVYTRFRIDGGIPRELIKIRGIDRPFRDPTLDVGTAEVRRIRTGYHPKSEGDELHVVLDLTDSAVRLDRVERDEGKLHLHVARVE